MVRRKRRFKYGVAGGTRRYFDPGDKRPPPQHYYDPGFAWVNPGGPGLYTLPGPGGFFMARHSGYGVF